MFKRQLKSKRCLRDSSVGISLFNTTNSQVICIIITTDVLTNFNLAQTTNMNPPQNQAPSNNPPSTPATNNAWISIGNVKNLFINCQNVHIDGVDVVGEKQKKGSS